MAAFVAGILRNLHSSAAGHLLQAENLVAVLLEILSATSKICFRVICCGLDSSVEKLTSTVNML